MINNIRVKEFLFTGFYSGYFPVAPGTAGTLVAMALYIFMHGIVGEWSWLVNVAIVACRVYPAISIADAGEKFFCCKDPSCVVIDEMVGYWIAVLFHPFSWMITIAAFIVFRLMDIIKPFPARRLQQLKGGLGIMIDDYIVGVYTNVVLIVFTVIARYMNVPIV